MISIIDYEAGNFRSVQNMLRHIGFESQIVSTPEDLNGATHLILPGVGHFDFGMRNLEERGLVDALDDMVIKRKVPILGICLGAQLLFGRSEEGERRGLGWIAGEVVGFDRSRLESHLRVPHIGWADTTFSQKSRLFRDVRGEPRYYHVHAFHLQCDDPSDEICSCVHGYRFTTGVERDNVFGVQFHPEKSHRFGMQILENFAFLS